VSTGLQSLAERRYLSGVGSPRRLDSAHHHRGGSVGGRYGSVASKRELSMPLVWSAGRGARMRQAWVGCSSAQNGARIPPGTTGLRGASSMTRRASTSIPSTLSGSRVERSARSMACCDSTSVIFGGRRSSLLAGAGTAAVPSAPSPTGSCALASVVATPTAIQAASKQRWICMATNYTVGRADCRDQRQL
jgi:hypothetical protein